MTSSIFLNVQSSPSRQDLKLRAVLQYLESNGFTDTALEFRKESDVDRLPEDAGILDVALDYYFSEQFPGRQMHIDVPKPSGYHTRTLRASFPDCGFNPTCVCWTSADVLAVGFACKEIKFFTLNNGEIEQIGFVDTPSPVLSVSCDVESPLLVTCMGGEVCLIENMEIVSVSQPHGSSHVWGSVKGELFFSFGRDGSLAVSNLESHKAGNPPLHIFRFLTKIGSACWSNEGEIIVALCESSSLVVLEIQTSELVKGKETGTIHLNPSLKDFSSEMDPVFMTIKEDLILVGFSGGTFRLYKKGSNCPIRNYYGFVSQDLVRLAATFSSDGGYIYMCNSTDGEVIVMETHSEQKALSFQAHQRGVRGIAQHPHKELIATISFDQSLNIWE